MSDSKKWILRDVPDERVVVPFEEGLGPKIQQAQQEKWQKQVQDRLAGKPMESHFSKISKTQNLDNVTTIFGPLPDEDLIQKEREDSTRELFNEFHKFKRQVEFILRYLNTKNVPSAQEIIKVLEFELRKTNYAYEIAYAKLKNPDMTLPEDFAHTDPEVVLRMQLDFIKNYLKRSSMQSENEDN